MASTVATAHTWQNKLEAAVVSENESSSTRSMERSTGDNNSDSSNQQAGINPGHGQPSGNQLYHTANPFPQPGAGWTPSPNAAPFYPQFPPFYNPGTPPVGTQPPYFDPNQQLAWAYQQMMLQQAMAQQHHQNQLNHAMAELGRVRANSGPQQQNDFFQQNQGGVAIPTPMIPGFPFQSSTPPAHPQPGFNTGPSQGSQAFRRGPQGHHMPGPRSTTFDNQDWNRNVAAPYARPDAAGSSHSVSSSTGSGQASAGGGARQRTASNNTNSSQATSARGQGSGPTRSSTMPQLTTDFERPRQQAPHIRHNSTGPPSPAPHSRTPHQRTTSNTSDRTIASARGQPPSASPTVSSNNPASTSSAAPSSANSSPNLSPVSRTNQRAPVKPSPLSQQQTFVEPSATSKRAKRLSKDDSELLPPTTVASALSARQSGLKGRFKRALAFNPPSSVDEHHATSSSVGHGDSSPNLVNGSSGDMEAASPVTPINAGESVRSTKPKSRAAALFSGKFNASTDNISLQSTVSSASVMIRKLGSIGKLARRNSLMGISSIFKDKNKDKGEGTSSSGKKSKKGEKAEATVSHATVELDRGGGSEDESWQNLTPAARVARQHTIKSNEEAAKRLREQAAAASAASAAAAMTNGSNGVPAWDKNTTTRRGEGSNRNVSEDGTVIDDRSDGSGEGGYDPQLDADATLRMPGGVNLDDDDDEEQWAVGLRRSIEKTRQPGKAVIKNHVGYVQEQHLDPPNQPFAARIRSNSYQTVSESGPGPLAHLPSPDPDHIDGLQRSNSTSNTPEKAPFSLPAFNFEFGDSIDILPKSDGENMSYDVLSSTPGALANSSDKGPSFAYTHPAANSSAPALSTIFNGSSGSGPAPAASLKALKKNITFAATLSIYDTFSASTYDRRSEPSTANRLTPALAQRIKEELNSFKMEEMEVHSASRIHTHFFV